VVFKGEKPAEVTHLRIAIADAAPSLVGFLSHSWNHL